MAEVNNANVASNGNVDYSAQSKLPQIPAELQGKDLKVQGQVDKQSLKKKLTDFLISDKIDSVGNYLYNCVFRPGIRNLLWQIGSGALSMFLLGGMNVQAPNMGGGYVPGVGWQGARRDPYPYQNQYGYMNPQPYNGYGYAQPQPGPYQPQPNTPSVNDISYGSKDEAWLVLDRLGQELRRYGKVKVADVYTYSGLTGLESNWVQQTTGWTNLATAQPIMRTDGRWMIQFPPVQMI